MKIVLFADNDPDFLNARAELLENVGYRVVRASTLEKAQELLANARIHLAVLDIRMVDDDDERDTSGLTLAKDERFRLVPKIILTGFPNYQAVREAMGVVVDGLPPAVSFISKLEEPAAMLRDVEQAFVHHVRINWDLQISLDPRWHLSFLHLASLLQPDLPNQIQLQWAEELEDLLRRLFYDYHQVRIGQLLWHCSNRFCLTILARSPRAAIDSRILVCGVRHHVMQELDRVKELAPTTIDGVRLADTAKMIRFATVAYELPDADMESIQTLDDLMVSGNRRSVRSAFDHLLKEVLRAWHRRGGSLEDDHDLMALYRCRVGLGEDDISRSDVKYRMKALLQTARALNTVEVEQSDEQVRFRFSSQAPMIYPDPVDVVYEALERYDAPVICTVSPGWLSVQKVLVDAEQRAWLTDFAQAGQAPQWWDFVCLEASVRFDTIEAPDLLAWETFEECLVSPASLHERIREQDVVSDLQLNVALIEQIRRQAGSETGDDPLPYYAGLLVWAVGAMAQCDPDRLYTRAERMRSAHLLLAASKIAKRLREAAKRYPMTDTGQNLMQVLRLADDGALWVGKSRITDLGGQELRLFDCLYKQVGKVVSRKELIETVFDESYVSGDMYQEGRLNSLVRRLRETLEFHIGSSHYITTVRGRGYRLETDEGSR